MRALTWNLFHGRDFPPDPALRTLCSRLLRTSERNDIHVQVNRELLDEFTSVLCGADWDVALLQECPPRWSEPLARACAAEPHRTLTARNALLAITSVLARHNPDLLGSWEGGSNLTLVRPAAIGAIAERRELVLRPGPRPERRTMAFTRVESGLCVANLHAGTDDGQASQEVLHAAATALAWAGESPVLLGGDFNVRPRQSPLYAELSERHGFSAPADPEAIDHLLGRGLEPIEPSRAWPPEAREVPDGVARLVIRLSDHAPVAATFVR